MPTILVIEDSEGQRADLRTVLEASSLFDRVLEARDGMHGLKLLLSEPVDIVLCDLEMPKLDGEKLLRMKSAVQDAEVQVPFLMLTGVRDAERHVKLLRQGASDTIMKPFHTADLIARIELHLKLVAAQRELVQKNRELERLSITDPLTGLANRRRLDEMLATEFARSRRCGSPFAVAMIDIDHFKPVNDDYGHSAGDAVLVEVARTIDGMVREADCAARYGGEEFLVLLRDNGIDGAYVFANRLRVAVADTKADLADGQSLGVTVSIGVAEWAPDLDGPAQLVERADSALYRAKAEGRDRVCCYGPD